MNVHSTSDKSVETRETEIVFIDWMSAFANLLSQLVVTRTSNSEL